MSWFEKVGRACGYGVGWLYRGLRSTWVRYGTIAALVVVLVPPVVDYWLSRVAIPEVPITALVAMGLGSMLLITFGGSLYVLFLFLSAILQSERSGTGSVAVARRRRATEETEGTFVPGNEERAWAQEQMETLKRAGLLTETDAMDIETLARENGFKDLQQKMGRTE